MKKIYEEPSVLIFEMMSNDVLLASGDVDLDVDWLSTDEGTSSVQSDRF